MDRQGPFDNPDLYDQENEEDDLDLLEDTFETDESPDDDLADVLWDPNILRQPDATPDA